MIPLDDSENGPIKSAEQKAICEVASCCQFVTLCDLKAMEYILNYLCLINALKENDTHT
jgi:hypothetical protein